MCYYLITLLICIISVRVLVFKNSVHAPAHRSAPQAGEPHARNAVVEHCLSQLCVRALCVCSCVTALFDHHNGDCDVALGY